MLSALTKQSLSSVMNSINRRKGTHQKKSEARSIGNSRYKNLKLKKKEEKERIQEVEGSLNTRSAS